MVTVAPIFNIVVDDLTTKPVTDVSVLYVGQKKVVSAEQTSAGHDAGAYAGWDNSRNREHISRNEKGRLAPGEKAAQEAGEGARVARLAVTDDPKTFKGLSREQLSEILTNRNGFYNADQKAIARSILWEELKEGYEARLKNNTQDAFGALADIVMFMDRAGPFEKQTFPWNNMRAAVVSAYGKLALREQRPATDFSIDSELYLRLKQMYDKVYGDDRLELEESNAPVKLLSNPEFQAIKDYYQQEMENGLLLRL
ncbi:MAG: Hypothetical protein BHV28_13900 [Candidatus Tokpelaia hoelldobleri]|uniref:Uncharacterized protein n=1 Tax=Candidatus Tokpelaia hoelldobleri TaxID=1902579 RepID=A0A1U9JW43_9HYPH|nr:MAG: Hypothetical protein BHV28_13900 [Candidatus Tokpelaia hoelldoblerii]